MNLDELLDEVSNAAAAGEPETTEEYDPDTELIEALNIIEDCKDLLEAIGDPQNKGVKLPGYLKKDVSEQVDELVAYLDQWATDSLDDKVSNK